MKKDYKNKAKGASSKLVRGPYHMKQENASLRAREDSPKWLESVERVKPKHRRPTVAIARRYAVTDVAEAKSIALGWLKDNRLEKAVNFGLPEVDDRYHIWRVPLIQQGLKRRLGEIVIDARTSLILIDKTTEPSILEARLLGRRNHEDETAKGLQISISYMRNTVIFCDSEKASLELPASSIDLIFTSPPYFNARPEYEDYLSYDEYLLKMRKIIHNCHRILGEGRFFIINISPILIRRASRNDSSTRIAVPFDFHRIFVEEGYDFIDDIIWQKPEGAGWATGRGRRFAADRNPLQYKPVPVTEYVLVYRKHSDKLIDWNIRNHPDREAVKRSRIIDNYDVTNIWRIKPSHSPLHPAVFPLELAQRVIRYYSFENDVILDPFAGIGTVGKAAVSLKRRFVLIENEKKYIDVICGEALKWLGYEAKDLFCVNCESPDISGLLPL